MRLTLQRAAGCPRPPRRCRFARAPASGFGTPLCAFARSRRGFAELDAGAPRLREPDRDRLLGRSGAVLALAHVMNLLAHELARLRRRRLPRTLVGACAPERFLLRHLDP